MVLETVEAVIEPIRSSSVGHAIGSIRKRAASMSAVVGRRKREDSETLVNDDSGVSNPETPTVDTSTPSSPEVATPDSGLDVNLGSLDKDLIVSRKRSREQDERETKEQRTRTISFSNPAYNSDSEEKSDDFHEEITSFKGNNSNNEYGHCNKKKSIKSTKKRSESIKNWRPQEQVSSFISTVDNHLQSSQSDPIQGSPCRKDSQESRFDTSTEEEESVKSSGRGKRKLSTFLKSKFGVVSMDTNNNSGRRHTIAASTIHHIHRLLDVPDDLSTASKFHSRLHGINERPENFDSNPSLGHISSIGNAKDRAKDFDGESACGDATSKHSKSEETIWSVLKELIVAFLLAGLGNVAAAYMLTQVRTWPVFKNIPQLFILVQPLLGLKGNVEMTLASRLSTHSNLGDLDTSKGKRSIIIGNMALVQCQASSVGFVAPFVALVLSLVSEENRGISFKEIILLTSSSVITANLANLLLGTVMCFTVVACRKYNVNPDNIATPIAASLGDVTTMILLANISHFLYVNLDSNSWIQNTLLIFLMSLIPIWAYIARKNPFTSSVILTGWFPVCGAMLLQNAGGLVMERALGAFDRLTMFQPVINGIGGNLVAIQASRMSTHLHKFSPPKELPRNDPSPWTYPGFTFINRYSAHTTMARLLILLVGPSQIIFVLVTKLINNHNFDITPLFMVTYVLIALVQVAILLQIAYNFVHWLWKLGIDPDNSAIPFLTAFADLIGSILLASAFVFLMSVGDPNAVISEHAPKLTNDNAASNNVLDDSVTLPSLIGTTLIYTNFTLNKFT